MRNLMQAYAIAKDYDEAIKIFTQISSPLKPTYEILIKALYEGNHIASAALLYTLAEQKGIYKLITRDNVNKIIINFHIYDVTEAGTPDYGAEPFYLIELVLIKFYQDLWHKKHNKEINGPIMIEFICGKGLGTTRDHVKDFLMKNFNWQTKIKYKNDGILEFTLPNYLPRLEETPCWHNYCCDIPKIGQAKKIYDVINEYLDKQKQLTLSFQVITENENNITNNQSSNEKSLPIGARLTSQRTIMSIKTRDKVTFCRVVPAMQGGDSGFTALGRILHIYGNTELPSIMTRQNFIKLVENLKSTNDNNSIITRLIDNIFKVDGVKNLEEWKNKFQKIKCYLQDVHFHLLSKFYNLKFYFYYLPKNNKCFDTKSENVYIYYGNNELEATTIHLAHISTQSKDVSSSPLSQYEGILIEPTEEQAEIIESFLRLESAQVYWPIDKNLSKSDLEALIYNYSLFSKQNLSPNRFSLNHLTENDVQKKGLNDEDKIVSSLDIEVLFELKAGEADNNGDCFFDSLAQSLNIINETDANTVKYLRMLCHDFYLKNKKLVDDWNQMDFRGIDKQKDEYYMVQYTFEECKKDFNGRSPIWGRPSIEGKILCKELSIEEILVIEMLEEPETKKQIPSYHVITSDEYKNISKEAVQQFINDPNIPILVVEQSSLHFVSFLRVGINLDNKREQQTEREEILKKMGKFFYS